MTMSRKTFCSKKIGIYKSDLKRTQKILKDSCAPADVQNETPDLPQLKFVWQLKYCPLVSLLPVFQMPSQCISLAQTVVLGTENFTWQSKSCHLSSVFPNPATHVAEMHPWFMEMPTPKKIVIVISKNFW